MLHLSLRLIIRYKDKNQVITLQRCNSQNIVPVQEASLTKVHWELPSLTALPSCCMYQVYSPNRIAARTDARAITATAAYL